MAHHSQPGGVARPCAARSASLADWGPRAAPASSPKPTLNLTVLARSTTRRLLSFYYSTTLLYSNYSTIRDYHGSRAFNQVKEERRADGSSGYNEAKDERGESYKKDWR